VSQENETVLKGRIAPKKVDKEGMEEEKDDGSPAKPIRPEDVGMGLNGDVEK